ncbi:MAG: glycosyltransferase family 39 protein [Candidatus Krumholzibacteriota bacterium]|nr:glycosyltransferase family 39 protein [Candidatus Krumholzibacteriota bacterium]
MAKDVEKNSFFLNLWKEKIAPSFSGDLDLLSVIVLLSLALRLYFAFAFDAGLSFGFADDFLEISEKGAIRSDQAPLYILFLRLLKLIFRDSAVTALYVFQGIVNTVCVVLLYLAARRVFDRKTALVAASIAALYPGFVLISHSPTPGSFEVLIVLAILTVALSDVGDMARGVYSSILIGIAVLLDPVMAFLVPGILLTLKRRFVFLLILAAILLPATIRNSLMEKKAVPVYRAEAYDLNFRKFYPSNLNGRWNTIWWIYENASMITRKEWALSDAAGTDQEKNSTYTAAYSYTAIMLLGLAGIARKYGKEDRFVLLPVASYTLLLILFGSFAKRYRIVLEPFFLLYASALLCRIKRRPRSIVPPGPL